MSLLLLFKSSGGGSTQTLTPGLYENQQAFFAPTVARGAVTLSPARYDNAQTFYSATITVGAVTLSPDRYNNAQTFYAAIVTSGQVTLTPALLVNSQTFYPPTVQSGAQQAAGGYDDDKPSKPKPRRFIQKRGDKLIVTTDASAALAAAEAASATAAEAETAPQAQAEPVAQEISLAEIRAVAAQYQQQAKVLQMFRQRDWAEMVALYEALRRQQDEDDIEMLLLSL